MLRIQHKSTEKTILSRQKMLRIQHKSTETSIFLLQQSFQNQASSRRNLCHNKDNPVVTKHSEFTTKSNKISVATKIIYVAKNKT